MPRVENLGKNVDDWYKAQFHTVGNGTSTWDVCLDCHSQLEDDPHIFDDRLEPYNGDPDGDEGRGGDIEHPDYTDGEIEYLCDVCKVRLTEEDNYA